MDDRASLLSASLISSSYSLEKAWMTGHETMSPTLRGGILAPPQPSFIELIPHGDLRLRLLRLGCLVSMLPKPP